MSSRTLSSFAAYPPTRHHHTTCVPPSRALALITAYLSASTTDTSLHPNALLTESGPITASAGSGAGLVLHNLGRVEAGLRGAHLGADFGAQKSSPNEEEGGEEVAGGGGIEAEGAGEEWQDRGEFERQQVVVGGEGRDGEVEAEVPRVRETLSRGDKQGRKRRKKERRAMDVREREMRRQREKGGKA